MIRHNKQNTKSYSYLLSINGSVNNYILFIKISVAKYNKYRSIRKNKINKKQKNQKFHKAIEC